MSDSVPQLLTAAVARHAGLVLSLPGPEGLAHHKSRFLNECDEGVQVVSAGEAAHLADLIAAARPVGVSFRMDGCRHLFAAVPLRHVTDFVVDGFAPCEMLLLKRPAEIKMIQRRAEYRVQVTPESGLAVGCWIIHRRADLRERPMPSQKLKIQVRDISMGGMGVTIFGQGDQPPAVTREDRLRVEVRLGDLELLVEGRMRASDAQEGPGLRTGIRFHFLDNGLDERLKVSQLGRIIGVLQMQQVRAIRRELTAEPAPTEPASA